MEDASIHQLIATHGVAEARRMADPRAVDAAFQVMTDESQRIGFLHAGFAMTSLPHRRPMDEAGGEMMQWVRQSGPVKLRIESGKDAGDTSVGLPFGSIARMILLYLQTQAVQHRTREVELGRSMNHWMKTMGIDTGGKNHKMVREQSKRISMCRLTFFHVKEDTTQITNGSFVRNAIIPTHDDADERQLNLWQTRVFLDETFYNSLIKHPLPVREEAIRALGNRSHSIDIYVWLAYRLHILKEPTPVTWKALYDQFGTGYKEVRQFRANFVPSLRMALSAYEEANVEVVPTGILLHPSDPPVRRRTLLTA